MLKAATVRFRLFRPFFVVAFIANAAAMFASEPWVSFLVAFLTVAFVVWAVRCAKCGKSPFVKRVGTSRIGIPIPERTCSKCGQPLFGDQAE